MSSRRRLHRYQRMPGLLLKRFMKGLFRILSRSHGRRTAQVGFVFPTTILLVLMVTLTATALTYRTFSRTEQAIAQRDQQVIYNAATPAIDRAKAKIEFMFQEDNRFPSGLPPSDRLSDLMLPAASRALTTEDPDNPGTDIPVVDDLEGIADPYTLPDERRLDINGDGVLDNAWAFTSDLNDDEEVVYSIMVDDLGPGDAAPGDANAVLMTDPDPAAKANALVTRTGPLATTEASPLCKAAVAEQGWQVVAGGDNSNLQKNFQINAFVANTNDLRQSFETLEFQQSRIAARANKWGAWFRYDLELHPGADFKWNGAMHTDGNLVLHGKAEPHMISSFNSCLYSQESSEITLGAFDNVEYANENPDNEGIDVSEAGKGVLGDFQGQAIKAKTADDAFTNGDMVVHIYNGDNAAPNTRNFNRNSDSVSGAGKPSDVAMNPLILYTQDKESHIDPTTWQRDANWESSDFVDQQRIYNDSVSKPFVDDFFRADDRWGPKPRYSSTNPEYDVTDPSNSAVSVGDDITGKPGLTGAQQGLDGYWERQAINKGLRVIVGERLELGNVDGWGYDPTAEYGASVLDANSEGDPLYPHKQLKAAFTGNNARSGGSHEHLHRKSLRDNLAAVQGMVVYHYEGPGMATAGSDKGNFPAACLAVTSHPGTQQSIINSRTFGTWDSTSAVKTDFLTGNGTNGWEFKYPTAFDTESKFEDEIAANQPLGIALRNLAHFAGDPYGGAPSFPAVQEPNAATPGDEIHPAPYLSMWGDFSVLRRIFEEYLDASTPVAYADLSSADKATLHSAACTLSMLAYNLENAQSKLSDLSSIPYADAAASELRNLGAYVYELIDGNTANGEMSSLVGTDVTYTDVDGSSVTITIGDRNGDGDVNDAGDLEALSDPVTDLSWTDPDDVGGTLGGACDNAAPSDTAGYQRNCDIGQYYSQFTTEEWIAAVHNQHSSFSDDISGPREYAEGIQILRDRAFGFVPNGAPMPLGGLSNVGWDPITRKTEAIGTLSAGLNTYTVNCDPDTFSPALANPSSSPPLDDTEPQALGLSLALCNAVSGPKYPSLYYLFPYFNHDHDGDDGQTSTAADNILTSFSVGFDHTQPGVEEYIADTYISDAGINGTSDEVSYVTYEVVGDDAAGSAGYELPADAGVGAIAALPGANDLTDWVTPASTADQSALAAPDDEPFRITGPDGNGRDVVFLDKGVFDGRELLNTRVLDMDLEALISGTAVNDFWLSAKLEDQAEGVVYAFREDAVREDEIVRPKNSDASVTLAYCSTVNRQGNRIFRLEHDDKCYMKADPASPQDPPLTDEGISLKPVDYIADPQRRANGFRLRTLSGDPADFSGGDPSADDARQVGMTFVTDNSIYIQGDFNLHTSDGTTANLLEEFDQTILGGDFTFNNFYQDRVDLNTGTFANLQSDHWRPVEILSDGMTILSADFEDGAISDMVTQKENGGRKSSYTNQNRPDSAGDRALDTYWVQQNPNDAESPLWIDRNGSYYYIDSGTVKPFYQEFTTDGEWIDFDEEDTERQRNQQVAVNTYVNAVFVSGIVPRRPRQGYGGLHNYPRFLENWSGKSLFIQGSFLQLNFSTASTGPQEQETYEPGQDPPTSEYLGYYSAPNRRWGYDVGLLYVPPAPASRRFVTLGTPRSEYYRELPADDPYVENLKCATDKDNAKIFPSLCP